MTMFVIITELTENVIRHSIWKSGCILNMILIPAYLSEQFHQAYD